MAAMVVLAVWGISGLGVSPGEIDFGASPVGKPSALYTVTLVNRSAGDLHDLRTNFEGEAAGDFHLTMANMCSSIAAGETCVLPVEFLPQEPGPRRASLVAWNADGSEVRTALLGTGRAGAVIVSPRSLDFGNVEIGSSAEKRIAVLGEGWFHVHGVSIDPDDGQFKATADTCLDTTPNLKGCTVQIVFRPTAAHAVEATLSLQDDGEGGPHTIAVRGTGTPPPSIGSAAGLGTAAGATSAAGENPPPNNATPNKTPPAEPKQPAISVDPLALRFVSGNQEPRVVNIDNRGDGPLQITSIAIVGNNRERFTLDKSGCGAEVPAHGVCSLSVSYKPKFWSGSHYEAQLQIDHNAPNFTSPQVIALSWERQEVPHGNAAFQPGALDFGSVQAGQTKQQTLTIVNVGKVDLKNISLRLGVIGNGEKGPFAHSNECRALAVGERCTVTVRFSSATPGSFSSTLYVCEGGIEQVGSIDLKAIQLAPIATPSVVFQPKVPNSEPGKLVLPSCAQPALNSLHVSGLPGVRPEVRLSATA